MYMRVNASISEIQTKFMLFFFYFQSIETLPETNKANDHMKKFAMLLKDDKRMRQFVKTLVGPDCNSQKAQELVVRLRHLFSCNYVHCKSTCTSRLKLFVDVIR